jgi:ABC-type polysaccharide/polyol phosphate transport system ATPase subunit
MARARARCSRSSQGVTLPSAGHVIARGRVASLLELGAGFHPVLTGRENIYLNAGLLGMRHSAVDAVFDQIVAFSEIGEFIDQPVDTYSSGMYVRIAFSVAVHTNPDIFLVDEVLAVGDEGFQRKCRVKIGELKEQGKTIVFVSHDLGLVNALCDRVVLLSKGKMVTRGTAQDTIQYYLRQVGRSGGIHAMQDGPHEAVFSHGRLALFRRGKEVSAPLGLSCEVASLGAYHPSSATDWEVADASPTGCTATAELPRLPVRLAWDMRLADGTLTWKMAMEIQRTTDIDSVQAVLALPQAFTAWHCAGRDGVFPDITPGHLDNSSVLIPEPKADECVLEAADGPLRVTAKALYPFVDTALYNSSYMTGARMLCFAARVPAEQRTLQPQRIDLFEVRVELGFDSAALAAWLDAQAARRTLSFGAWTATLRPGRIEIARGGRPVTASVHLHTELCAGSMWSLSQAYRWEAATLTDGRLTARGECLRLPYDEQWELWQEGGRLRWRVSIVVKKAFECQEHNATIALVPEYDHFDLGAESGAFPPFDPAVDYWKHANHAYGISETAKASGPGLPTLTLGAPACPHSFRMSALNTGFAQGARVLQAIHSPEREGVLHFAPGTHVLFDGYAGLED